MNITLLRGIEFKARLIPKGRIQWTWSRTTGFNTKYNYITDTPENREKVELISKKIRIIMNRRGDVDSKPRELRELKAELTAMK